MRLSISDACAGALNAGRANAATIMDMEHIAFIHFPLLSWLLLFFVLFNPKT